MMKKSTIFLIWICFFQTGYAQKIKNPFFTLHNIIRGDNTYQTFDQQVELVKNAGFDGIEINSLESFVGMKQALDKHQFVGSFFYVKLNLEPPFMDARLEGFIKQLKGTKTIISPYLVSDSKRFKPSSHDADTLVIRLLTQLSDWSKASNLQVAIYPHVGFYVEKTSHALAIVKGVNRSNLGLSFNLCHWLATTTSEDRALLKPHLRNLKPYLKMITICGANDLISQDKNVWNDYILPLGQGNFDTFGLVNYLIRELKYKNPIGVQCYNIKGNKPELVRNTMAVWKLFKQKEFIF